MTDADHTDVETDVPAPATPAQSDQLVTDEAGRAGTVEQPPSIEDCTAIEGRWRYD